MPAVSSREGSSRVTTRLWETIKGIGWAIRSRSGRWAIPAALCLLVVAGGLWQAWHHFFGDLPSPDMLYQQASKPTTKIFDRNGRLLYEVMDPHAGRHSPVPLDHIPLALRQATIATEDRGFYHNPGVDVRGIVRAVIINLQGGEVIAGGSTITQQLARNLLLSPQERGRRTLLRKLRETVLAYRLALSYSKDEILALYLNETYYGNMAYGVEAAARAYFGKSVSDLDLAECAMLAGLPQAPALYDPLVEPEAARKRQAVVLDLMVKAGFITAEQAKLAKEEKLHFAATRFPIRAPHFVMHVHRVLRDRFGLEMLQQGGLRVYTTLDLDMQNAAERIVRRQLTLLNERKEGSPGVYGARRTLNIRNGALVALDPRSGEILAMLGSPDYFDPRIDGAVNVALATRQPGSSIKPITYALAFSRDYTPATMVLDVRTSFLTRQGEPYVPYNYDRLFRGPVLLREALASSLNLVAVRVLDHVGLKDMIDFARKLGIETFDDSERFGLALTLGGGEVRLLELTAAYAAFANGGRRVEPVAISRVEDAQGRVLMQRGQDAHAADAEVSGSQVMDPRVAYLITHILSDDTARMSGFGLDSVLNLTRPAAVKTGTTTDWRDNWTIGYTPELAVGVWVGNADNEPMGHVSGITGAAPIWHNFMEEALKGKPVQNFVEPPGLTRVEVCALSGLLPTANCPHRKTELFIAGSEPQVYCDMHQKFRVDRATGYLATADTPLQQVVERVYTVLPAEAQEWARQRHLPRPPEPPPGYTAQMLALEHPSQGPTVMAVPQPVEIPRPGELLAERDEPMVVSHRPTELPLVMTDPDAGATYRISPQIPLSSQCLHVAARVGDLAQSAAPLRSVTLLADGAPIGEYTQPPYRGLWCLQPGEHVFQARGIDALGREVESDVVRITVVP